MPHLNMYLMTQSHCLAAQITKTFFLINHYLIIIIFLIFFLCLSHLLTECFLHNFVPTVATLNVFTNQCYRPHVSRKLQSQHHEILCHFAVKLIRNIIIFDIVSAHKLNDQYQ